MFQRVSVLFFFLAGLMSPGCAVLLPAAENTNQVEGQSVKLVVHGCTVGAAPPEQAAESALLDGVGAAAVVFGFDLAKGAVGDALQSEKTRYEHTSTARTTLYTGNPATEHTVLTELVFTRTVDEERAATFICDFVAASPGSDVYGLRPRSVSLDQAGAKLLDTRWYLPWTWFYSTSERVALEAQVKIEALVIDQKTSKVKRETLVDTSLALPRLRPGSTKTYGTDGFGQDWVAIPRGSFLTFHVSLKERDPAQSAALVETLRTASDAALDEWQDAVMGDGG